MSKSLEKIAIVGLGYVGLPLAIGFSKIYQVVGFDINKKRVKDLSNGSDSTNEIINQQELLNKNIVYSSDPRSMKGSNFFIITVPTPTTKSNKPDLSIIGKAANLIAPILEKGATVILESTVYPGVTETYLVPILSKVSKLKYKKDFFVAYSPERINPGESKYKLTNIKKVIGADNKKTLLNTSKLYKSIIKAGVHEVSSIKVAEASKAIENAQRDINIAFVNEVMMLSKALNIDSNEVLEAAGTKWNFINFKPGLVGGHCIGVDPYYLAEAGRKVNYKTEIILAGRKVNDSIPNYLYKNIKSKINKRSRILLLGLTFKEDVGDIRNSKSAELANKIMKGKFKIDCFDPKANKIDLLKEYNIKIKKPSGRYDCIIVAVSHKEFIKMRVEEIFSMINEGAYIIDIKGIWKKRLSNKHKNLWCL
jgi:UDP-N-acetyl-D-glucosamine/UDP-N-acetyl-D-galactosamine dehydrogenase